MKTTIYIFAAFLISITGFTQKIDDLKRNIPFTPNAVGDVDLTSSTLPIVVIETSGQTIPDEPGIIAHMGIINNGFGNVNNITDPFNEYDGDIDIEIRGNSSQFYPKKSYSVSTVDALGEDENHPLFGLPSHSDWALIATAFDKTLLRNSLMYKLWGQMGYYSVRTIFCEVVLNGEYIGVYTFTERIKRNTNRVNISKLTYVDTTSKISGGYIINTDYPKVDDVNYWQSPYSNSNTDKHYIVIYPKPADLHPKQFDYIKQYFLDFETTLLGSNYKDTVNGYRKYIDESTFIDYFLIQEFCKNLDAYMASIYFNKDRNGKIKLGPVWDFDAALSYDGTPVECSENDLTSGWNFRGTHCLAGLAHFWWERFLTDCKYTAKLRTRYQYLRQHQLSSSNVNALIDSLANQLEVPQTRNWEKWGLTFLGTSVIDYPLEINLLKNWIAERLLWMDENIDDIDTFSPVLSTTNAVPSFGSTVTLTTNTLPANATVLWEWQLSNQEKGSFNSGTSTSLSVIPRDSVIYRARFINNDATCNSYYSNDVVMNVASLCTSNINMTETISSPTTPSAFYKSSNLIQASGKVESNAKAKFQSEKSIIFLPGFSSESGGIITAEIKNCN